MRITEHFCNTGTCTFTIPLNRLIKEGEVTVLIRKPEREKKMCFYDRQTCCYLGSCHNDKDQQE